MLFANGIMLIDKTQERIAKLNLCRKLLESNGLHLNRSKTEYIECKFNRNGDPNEIGVRMEIRKYQRVSNFIILDLSCKRIKNWMEILTIEYKLDG